MLHLHVAVSKVYTMSWLRDVKQARLQLSPALPHKLLHADGAMHKLVRDQHSRTYTWALLALTHKQTDNGIMLAGLSLAHVYNTPQQTGTLTHTLLCCCRKSISAGEG